MATGLRAPGSRRGWRQTRAEAVRLPSHCWPRARSQEETAAASAKRLRDRIWRGRLDLRADRYPNAADANEARTAQIAAHRPSDSARSTVRAARLGS